MKYSILDEDLDYIFSQVKNKGKWNNATIIITGCAGFLGFYFMHFFTKKSKELGIKKIICLDSFILEKTNWLISLENNFSSILHVQKFDVSGGDISKIKGALDANYIVHAASIASPSYYRKFPIATIEANVFGLKKLLDFYKTSSELLGFLFFSSSEIYGDPDIDFIPTSENYRGNVNCIGPRACYDESKRFGETLCWVYSKEYSLPITVARPFNNYGPGMKLNDKRLPADFAKSIITNENISILSDGSPKRTFCYISDAMIGYLLCLTHGRYDFFNIGSDKPEISVKDFAEIFLKVGTKINNYKGRISYIKSDDLDYMTDNPNRRCPIIDKAKTKLGYNPKISLDEGISRYLTFLKGDI